jgi:hypothetical protein
MAREREECGHNSRERLSPEEYRNRAAALIQRVSGAVRLADARLRGEPGRHESSARRLWLPSPVRGRRSRSSDGKRTRPPRYPEGRPVSSVAHPPETVRGLYHWSGGDAKEMQQLA